MSTAFLPVQQQGLRLHRVALATLLALVLVCAQSLGLWHRLVHPGPGQLDRLDAAAQATVADTATAHSLFTQLFSLHQGDADCQFFDHASHGDAISTVSTAVVGLALAPRLLVDSHGLFVARWHALFQARGPPSVR
ncbi:MAG: hypothetical protein V4858_17415 [Pseudomonadota bacterium]